MNEAFLGSHQPGTDNADAPLPASWFSAAALQEEKAGDLVTATRVIDLGLRFHPLDVSLGVMAGLLRYRSGDVVAGLDRLERLLREASSGAALAALIESVDGRVEPAAFIGLVEAVWPGESAPPLVKAAAGRMLLKHGERRKARLLLTAASAEGVDLPDWVRWETQRAVWTDPDEIDLGPAILRQEVVRFGQAMARVLAGDAMLPREDLPSPRFTSHTLAACWLRSACRVISSTELSQQDKMFLLETVGVADRFLELAEKGAEAVGEACFAYSTDVPQAADRSIPLRIRDALSVAALRAKPIICPFTGERALVRDSIALYTYVHRSEAGLCLVLSAFDWVNPLQDAAYFFPTHGILLVLGRAEVQFFGIRNLRLEVAEACATVMNRRHDFSRYFATDERSVGVVQLTTAHVGHDLWNGLSAWDRLFELATPEQFDHLVVDGSSEIYGPLNEVFPDHSELIGQRVIKANRRQVVDVILKKNALMVSLRDNYITQRLATRVIAAQRRRCSPAFLERVAALRAACHPLLLVTIRLGNRAWAEQEEGYIALIRRLRDEAPRMGIVLDGMNAGTDKGSTHVHMSLDDEIAMAARIEAALRDDIMVHNSIGAPIEESVVLADVVDAFVAPVGAGMAKYRWLANKPGVAFGNQTILRPNNYDGTLYCNPRYREFPRSAVFVERENVIDLEAERLGLPFRANFSMHWQAIHEKISPLIADLVPIESEPT